MRASWLTLLAFLLLASVWALQLPFSSWLTVKNLAVDSESRDTFKLVRAGTSATLALQHGLNSGSVEIRLPCARALALRGDKNGDRALFAIVRHHGAAADGFGAKAEAYLIDVWNQREGPPAVHREKLARVKGQNADRDALPVLNELLERYPGWSNGYVLRARLHLRNGEGLEARRQTLIALAIEEENFEAMVVLSQAYLLINSPEQSYLCLQQAVRLNPRLRHSLQEDIKEALKSIDLERARRRRDKRREVPVA